MVAKTLLQVQNQFFKAASPTNMVAKTLLQVQKEFCKVASPTNMVARHFSGLITSILINQHALNHFICNRTLFYLE